MSVTIHFTSVAILTVASMTPSLFADNNAPSSHWVPRFEVTTDKEAADKSFGTLMICPAHAHGASTEGLAKLKAMIEKERLDQPVTIWVCRKDQTSTIRRFAPEVERIIVSPFIRDSKPTPVRNHAIWGASDLPLLNDIRSLRLLLPGKQLIACLDVDGEPRLFGERAPSLEEIEWQAFAVCGANFQGIAWRGGKEAGSNAARGAARLSDQLRQQAGELAAARPVSWAHDPAGHPVASLRTNTALFIILLNPLYMKSPDTPGVTTIQLPVEAGEHRGELILTPPAGISLGAGRTLGGRRVNLEKRSDVMTVRYAFRGGGDMMIFALSGASDEDFADSPPPIRFRPPTTHATSPRVQVETRAESAQAMTPAGDEPSVAAFRERMKLVEELSQEINLSLAESQAASLESLIGVPPRAQTREATAQVNKSAAELLRDYQDAFAEPLPMLNVSHGHLHAVKEQYNALIAATHASLAERGRVVMAMANGGTGEAALLCAIIPFLHIPDEQWSHQHITALPVWMRRPAALASLEHFALSIRRPLSAYRFFLARADLRSSPAASQPALGSYFRDASERLLRAREYAAAITCLRTGIAAAERESHLADVVSYDQKLWTAATG